MSKEPRRWLTWTIIVSNHHLNNYFRWKCNSNATSPFLSEQGLCAAVFSESMMQRLGWATKWSAPEIGGTGGSQKCGFTWLLPVKEGPSSQWGTGYRSKMWEWWGQKPQGEGAMNTDSNNGALVNALAVSWVEFPRSTAWDMVSSLSDLLRKSCSKNPVRGRGKQDEVGCSLR